MRFKMSQVVVGLLSSALLLLAVAARPQEPALGSNDLPALLQAADRTGAAMHRRLIEYTYLQTRRTRERGPGGRLLTWEREFEAYPIRAEGRHWHVLTLIRRDGVSLSPEEVERNRRFTAREMESAAAGEGAPGEKGAPGADDRYITAGIGIGGQEEGVWLGVSQFLRQCQFADPRRTQLAERPAIAVSFQSCASASASPRDRYLAKLAGTVWIDVADQVVVRLEAWPAASPEPETIVYEQQRVQGGIWAPRRIRLNGLGKDKLFNGVDKEIVFEFNDYRHFSTEIKEGEPVPPAKPPAF